MDGSVALLLRVAFIGHFTWPFESPPAEAKAHRQLQRCWPLGLSKTASNLDASQVAGACFQAGVHFKREVSCGSLEA